VSYAKTSLRAEQRALRDKMRAQGLSHRQIAFEFGRRYGMRPRTAWRHAHGWSLKQAAERITAYAAQAGLDPAGNTVAMTGPHLCETENWPGHGPEPSGRRPTPYLLSLLAAVYDCAIADLLDLADYQHMRPADLVVLDKTADPDGQRGKGAPAGTQIRPRPVTQVARPPEPELVTSPSIPTPAHQLTPSATCRGAQVVNGRETEPRGAELGELGWELSYRQAREPEMRSRDSAESPAGADAWAQFPERALIEAAAHQSSEHAGWAEASNVGEATLEQLDADVRHIASDYVYAPPLPMFEEMLRVRNRIYRLLAGRQKPAATAHLHLLAGVVCGLLANASTDLGYRDAAGEQARAAWAYGEIIDHNGLRAWTRGMQALIEYWSERPRQAVRLAQSAQRYADSATAQARLCSIEARVWARLGDDRETSRCLQAAAQSWESGAGSEYLHDEVGGVFGFSDAKYRCYQGAAFMHLGQAGAALQSTSQAVELYASGPAAQRSYGAESLARIDMAAAYLLNRRLDGAANALAPVLAIPPGKRIAQFCERLTGVRRGLADPEFSGAREARDLCEQIESFCGDTVVQLPLPSAQDS
jgi:hypothetical protein